MYFFAIFPIPNNVTHEPQPRNPTNVPFVVPSYLHEKKGLRFDIIFLNNTKYVLSNPESFLFSKNKNDYGKNATRYHTNHLLKKHAKWFWSFNHFSGTMVNSNVNQGVLQTLEHGVPITCLL